MKKKNIIIAVGILVVAGTGLFFAFNGQLANNGPVAVVNGEKISQKDYNFIKSQVKQRLSLRGKSPEEAEVRKQTLNQLIGQELLIQKVKEQDGLEVTQEEVNKYYQNVIDKAGGEKALNRVFKELDISEEYIRNDIRNQLLIQKYVMKKKGSGGFEVDDQEIQDFYNQIKEQAPTSTPALSQIRLQVKSRLVDQKKSVFLSNIISKLKREAQIEILR